MNSVVSANGNENVIYFRCNFYEELRAFVNVYSVLIDINSIHTYCMLLFSPITAVFSTSV
jgi:hypothetical protein